jgi:hypothetical protein
MHMGDCTFVNAYCCSGERFAFRKRRTSYWRRMRSGRVEEYQGGKSGDLIEQVVNFSKFG